MYPQGTLHLLFNVGWASQISRKGCLNPGNCERKHSFCANANHYHANPHVVSCNNNNNTEGVGALHTTGRTSLSPRRALWHGEVLIFSQTAASHNVVLLCVLLSFVVIACCGPASANNIIAVHQRQQLSCCEMCAALISS